MNFLAISDGEAATTVIFVLIPIALLALYPVPVVIAACRSHPNTVPILLVNLFLGWTFLGWFVALVWACTSTSKSAVVIQQAFQPAKDTIPRNRYRKRQHRLRKSIAKATNEEAAASQRRRANRLTYSMAPALALLPRIRAVIACPSIPSAAATAAIIGAI
jgi:glucan phosphoethanolaminetransferase (alkaline phosphatase superfamily)